MFEFFLRKTVMKKLSKEDQDVWLLKKDGFKMQYFAYVLIFLLVGLPFSEWIAVLIIGEYTLTNLIIQCIIILVYIIFVLHFIHMFNEQIEIFTALIMNKLFFGRYVVKGGAISKDEFDVLKKENENLYNQIRYGAVQGTCYSTCFKILQCLKRGQLHFVAIKKIGDDTIKNYYTMHVLYVWNDWCFDTYSARQYPLEKVMTHFRGKLYTTFSYQDIEGKTYQEFKEENYAALEKWCQENDCNQVWMKV